MSRPQRDVAVAAALICCVCLSVVSGETQHCVEISNNVQYNVEQMEGTWFPVEIVLHRNDSKIYGVPLDPQCPTVTVTVSRNRKTLTMLWNTTKGDIEYKFTAKGRQWQAVYDQKGSLVTNEYKQYGGIFRVLKLDGDNMFLTYCSKSYRVLNTVAFSRNGTMPQDLIEETLKELEDRKIKRSTVFKVKDCDEEGVSSRVVPCFLTVLASLVVRFSL